MQTGHTTLASLSGLGRVGIKTKIADVFGSGKVEWGPNAHYCMHWEGPSQQAQVFSVRGLALG